jgi:hypothetical protein
VQFVHDNPINPAFHMALDVGGQWEPPVSTHVWEISVRVIGNGFYSVIYGRLLLNALQIFMRPFAVNKTKVRNLNPFRLVFRHQRSP